MSLTGIIDATTRNLLKWGHTAFTPGAGQLAAPLPLPGQPKRMYQRNETQMHQHNDVTDVYDLVAQPPPLWPVITVSASRTLTKEKLVIVTASCTQTLPAVHQLGDEFELINAAASGDVTIGRNGNQIDGAADDLSLAPGDKLKVVSDGTDWWSTTLL